MALDRISLTQFRNHSATALEGTAHFNLLVGENGAGKTNILEALSLLAPGRGMRRAPLPDMVLSGANAGFTVAASLKEQGHESARLGTYTEAEHPSRRLVRINGAAGKAVQLGEWLSIGWLTPAMDGLFADSAGARRRYLDRLALALDPAHARHAARYEAAIRERNKLLERNSENTWLDAIEAQASEYGALLAAGRQILIERMRDELSALPDQPFARPLLAYRAGGPLDREELRLTLAQERGRDRAAGRALIGPHRDELEVVMAGSGQAAASCSTGEQKAMLIAMTLAHAALSAEGRPGVMLLDEVAAHLDSVRRQALFDRLRQTRTQVWFTGTDKSAFAEILEEAAVWNVADGAVTRA